jgi:hypothetical protein
MDMTAEEVHERWYKSRLLGCAKDMEVELQVSPLGADGTIIVAVSRATELTGPPAESPAAGAVTGQAKEQGCYLSLHLFQRAAAGRRSISTSTSLRRRNGGV